MPLFLQFLGLDHIYLSNLLIYLSICLSIYLSTYLSIYLTIYLSMPKCRHSGSCSILTSSLSAATWCEWSSGWVCWPRVAELMGGAMGWWKDGGTEGSGPMERWHVHGERERYIYICTHHHTHRYIYIYIGRGELSGFPGTARGLFISNHLWHFCHGMKFSLA